MLDSQCPSIHSFYFYPKACMKTSISHSIFMLVVSLVITNDWRKYPNLEMSKKENVAGWIRWQGKIQAYRERFFWSQTTEGHQDSCNLIWKIAFTFVEKSVVTCLKQIVNKTSELLFYWNENWHKTLKAFETCPEIINVLLSKCSLIWKTDAWKSLTLNI